MGTTYTEICSVYTAYVLKKYGEAVVVFDGYDGKSTKDMTHQRRTKGQAGVTWQIRPTSSSLSKWLVTI